MKATVQDNITVLGQIACTLGKKFPYVSHIKGTFASPSTRSQFSTQPVKDEVLAIKSDEYQPLEDIENQVKATRS